MPNMSYCRMENTWRDLVDCYDHMEDELSESEKKYRDRIIEKCKTIAALYDDEDYTPVTQPPSWATTARHWRQCGAAADMPGLELTL